MELANIDMRRRRVQLNTYIAQRMPLLMCDPILIEQVLINLMKNGIEAMAQAPERVLVVRVRGGAGHLVIDVIDRGTGIDASAQARLFEPFYSTKVEGMGMGLAMAQRMAGNWGAPQPQMAAQAGPARFLEL